MTFFFSMADHSTCLMSDGTGVVAAAAADTLAGADVPRHDSSWCGAVRVGRHTQHQQRAMARQFSGPFWLGSLLLPWRKAARAHTEPFFVNYYSAMGGEERTDLGWGAVPFTSPRDASCSSSNGVEPYASRLNPVLGILTALTPSIYLCGCAPPRTPAPMPSVVLCLYLCMLCALQHQTHPSPSSSIADEEPLLRCCSDSEQFPHVVPAAGFPITRASEPPDQIARQIGRRHPILFALHPPLSNVSSVLAFTFAGRKELDATPPQHIIRRLPTHC